MNFDELVMILMIFKLSVELINFVD